MTGTSAERPWRGPEVPPLAIAALLGAAFFAILSASEPLLIGPAGSGQAVTLIIDRGLTMSARPNGGAFRFVMATASAESSIDEVCPGAKIILRLVPPVPGSSDDASSYSAESTTPSASADPDALALAVRRALVDTPGSVVLVSDLQIPVEDPRFVQITPENALNGAGIDSLTVVGDPHPQAMVRVSNQSDSTQASLTLQSDDKQIDSPILLPPRGEAKNYFIDLPNAGAVVEATLHADGDTILNQRAWAVRRDIWPKIVAGEGIGPELRKMIDVYTHLRPSGPDSKEVTMSVSLEPLEGEQVGAAWVLPQPDDVPLDMTQSLKVDSSPFSTEGVDWLDILSGATAARTGPSADWQPMVTVGNVVVVAARTRPVRQVWVGFQSTDFPDRPDFVVFWSQVFNWLGNAGSVYEASATAPIAGDWIPGLYVDPTGQKQALNAPPMPTQFVTGLDWRATLSNIPPQLRRGTRGIGGFLSIIALILAVVAAATWQKRKRTFPAYGGRMRVR
jgi:hypothetical protein